MGPGFIELPTAYENQLVSVDVRPAVALGLVVAAMTVGMVITWRRAGRAEEARTKALVALGEDPARTGQELAGLAVVGFASAAGVAALVIASLWAYDEAPRVLRPLFGALGVLNLVGGGVAMAASVRFMARPTRAAAGPLGGVLAGAAVLGIATAGYAVPVAKAGLFEIDAPPDHRVHAGGVRTVQAVMLLTRRTGFFNLDSYRVASRDGYGWTLESTKVDARAPGEIRATMTAKRPFMRMHRRVALQVGEDRPDTSVSLAPGNRWVYRARSHSSTARILGESTSSTSEGGSITVEVGRSADRDGLRAVELAVTTTFGHDGGPTRPPRREAFWVYGWNGQTFVAWGAGDGREARLPTGPAQPLVAAGPRAADDQVPVGYLPGYNCRLGAPPGKPGPVGPVDCVHVRESSPLAAVELLLFMATLGASGITSEWQVLELAEASGT